MAKVKTMEELLREQQGANPPGAQPPQYPPAQKSAPGGSAFTPQPLPTMTELLARMSSGGLTPRTTAPAPTPTPGAFTYAPFQFDLNADMAYQTLRQQYVQNGQRAAQDTMGQAAQLAGGYGTTYGQAAGQQQYDSYLQGLNATVPQLEANARQQYDADRDQAHQEWTANRTQAYNTAMLMLQNGQMPSAEMLTGAGISQADADKILAGFKKPGGGGGGGGGGTKQGPSKIRTADNLRAADAYMRGGTAALDNFLRQLEQEGVSAADLMMLRRQIMQNYKPDPDRITQATEGMGDGRPIPGGR